MLCRPETEARALGPCLLNAIEEKWFQLKLSRKMQLHREDVFLLMPCSQALHLSSGSVSASQDNNSSAPMERRHTSLSTNPARLRILPIGIDMSRWVFVELSATR